VFARLQGLQYRIQYRKGTENGAADALSHRFHPEQLTAISSVQHQWLTSVTQSYASDPKAHDLLIRLAFDPASVPPFTLSQGIIRYKNRIWLGSYPSAQQHVLQAFHASPVGGHSSFPITYNRIKQLFYWAGMKSAIRSFVQSCVVCLQAKPDRARYLGLLQPLPVPSAAWEVITMDFIEGLPQSKSANATLVVDDVDGS